MTSLERLMQLMRRLREPESGCPWDIKQTFHSLVPYTLEEVYELVDTIEEGDIEHLREELGDYLFQAAFYAQIANENGWFDLEQVIDELVDKLVARHPHVFPDGRVDGCIVESDSMRDSEIRETWEKNKSKQRRARRLDGVLDDVPKALPALQRAQKLQKRVAGVGFDWTDAFGPLDKLREELLEFQQAMRSQRPERVEHEIGDLLFTCVNLARHCGLSAEQSLAAANRRFESRFRSVEAYASQRSKSVADLTLAELENLWVRAKREEAAE